MLLDGDGPGSNGGDVNDGDDEPWEGDVETSRMAIERATHDDDAAGGVACVALSRRGRFCRVHAAVPKSADDIDAATVAAFRAVVRAVENAGLTVRHVGCARAFVASDETLDTETVLALANAVDGVLEVQCAVVPVLRASFGSVDDAFMVLELTAVS